MYPLPPSFSRYIGCGTSKKCFLQIFQFEHQVGIYEYFFWKVHESSDCLSYRAPSQLNCASPLTEFSSQHLCVSFSSVFQRLFECSPSGGNLSIRKALNCGLHVDNQPHRRMSFLLVAFFPRISPIKICVDVTNSRPMHDGHLHTPFCSVHPQ